MDGITIGVFIPAMFAIFVEGLHYFSSILGDMVPIRSTANVVLSLLVLFLGVRRMHIGAFVNQLFHEIEDEIGKLKISVGKYKAMHKYYLEGNIIAIDDFHKELLEKC